MTDLHYFPVGRHPVLERERVVETALAGQPALVVLWGPGGTGKTVAAAQIAERLARGDSSAVWVRFADAEPGFAGAWRRIFTALVESGAAEGGSAELLRAGGLATAPQAAVNEALAELRSRTVLVLDDAHLVSDERFEASLVEALECSAGLTAIVASRPRPPVLLGVDTRMRLPVREVEADELAFTPVEVDRLLELRDPRLAAEERAVETKAIHRTSGGWPLAAHAAIVERDLGHERRLMASRPGFVREHVDRMLAAVRPPLREALCATAIFDDFSAELIAAMLGIEVAAAEELLEGDPESSLVHWQAEDGTRWYRHHDLIRDELLRRAGDEVGGERLKHLHRRAAAALQGARTEAAIQAAIYAEAWDMLGPMLLRREAQRVVARSERAGKRYLRDIPKDVRERYPVLAAFALIDEYAYPTGRFERVVNGFKMLTGSALASEASRAGLPGITAAVLRLVAARLSGNQRLSLEMADRAQEAMAGLSDDELERYRPSLVTGINQTAIAYLHADRFEDAERALEAADSGTEQIAPLGSAHALALRAFSTAWRGELLRAREAVERCEGRELPVGWRGSYSGSGYRIAAALCSLEAGDADGAGRHLAALAAHEATIEHWPYLAMLEALIAETRFGAEEALTRLDSELGRRRRRFAWLDAHERALTALRHRLLWHAGRVLPRERRGGDLASVYTALAWGRPGRARTLLGSLLLDETVAESPRRRVELLLLQATAAQREGDAAAAARTAELGLGIMDEKGLSLPLRALNAEALSALADLVPALGERAVAFPAASSVAAPAQPELRALSAGEQRALQAVADRGSVAAAAEALFISRQTVKSHLRLAYRKLGVHSRADAIRVASEAGMIRVDADPEGSS